MDTELAGESLNPSAPEQPPAKAGAGVKTRARKHTADEVGTARRECATRNEFAERIGIAVKGVTYHLRVHALPLYERKNFTERNVHICNAYNAGKSLNTIAHEFSLTRNQVAGILSRNGMFKTRRKATIKSKPPKPIRRAPLRQFKSSPFRPAQDPVVPLGVNLTDLAHDQCRWPYGEGPYTFCGHKKSASHKSYCDHHAYMGTNHG